MFKGLANLGNLMKNAQEVGNQLRARRVSGTAGGGMVQVEANGLGEILRLTIDPQLIEGKEQDMIEDLVPAAVNQAIRNAREAHAEVMRSLADGLNIPGLEEMMAKFTGGSGGTDMDLPGEKP